MVNTRKNVNIEDAPDEGMTLNAVSLSLFKKIINDVVSARTSELLVQIAELKTEVSNLRQSNIDLVRLVSAKPSLLHAENGSRNISNKNFSCKSTDSTSIKTSAVSNPQNKKRKDNEVIGNQSATDIGQKLKSDKNIGDSSTVRRGHSHQKTKIIVGTGAASPAASGRDGTGTGGSSGGFAAAGRRLWLYVGRCLGTVTCEDVDAWMGSKWPGHTFDISRLISKGKNASFRVGVDAELQDEVYKSECWPKDVVIKRYRFFRSRNDASR